jgi:hypothetical protein
LVKYLVGEIKCPEKTMLQYHFVLHKFHFTALKSRRTTAGVTARPFEPEAS